MNEKFYEYYRDEFRQLQKLKREEFDGILNRLEMELADNPTYTAQTPLLLFKTNKIETYIYLEGDKLENTYVFGYTPENRITQKVKLKSKFVGEFPRMGLLEDTETFNDIEDALYFLIKR